MEFVIVPRKYAKSLGCPKYSPDPQFVEAYARGEATRESVESVTRIRLGSYRVMRALGYLAEFSNLRRLEIRGIANIRGIVVPSGVEYLKIEECAGVHVSFLELRRLEMLILRDCEVARACFEAHTSQSVKITRSVTVPRHSCARLTYLDIRGSDISYLPSSVLPRVTHLRAEGTAFEWEWADGLANLKNLSVSAEHAWNIPEWIFDKGIYVVFGENDTAAAEA